MHCFCLGGSSGSIFFCKALCSRGLGVNFLPAKGFKRGPPHCVETTSSYRYCRLKPIIQWCIAKNRGGYTLEMRHRRCRATSAEGTRIEALRGVVFLGRGCPPPQPTTGSGGASWAPPEGSRAEPRPPARSRHISAPQKLSSRRLLKFWGPEICLVETMHYGVYVIVKCE